MIAIFLFYDKGFGKQGCFTTHDIRHCNLITYDGKNWVLVKMTPKGITFRILRVPRSDRLIHHLHNLDGLIYIIVANVIELSGQKWFPLWVRSCNELCRYISGIDVGFTYNPTHLIKKLVKYNNQRNYEIIYQWSRNCGR